MPAIDTELFQRLSLLNQYTILAKVDPANASTWEAAAEGVRSNWPIDDLPDVDYLNETARDPVTVANRRFILDVMSLYEYLQHAEDSGIAKAGSESEFPGFDGNNETKLMSYARDLVERQRRFTTLRYANKDFNSHHPTLEMYGRMLDEYERRGNPYPLSVADYDAILDARTHPANRR